VFGVRQRRPTREINRKVSKEEMTARGSLGLLTGLFYAV
jgi:hypothetical protein